MPAAPKAYVPWWSTIWPKCFLTSVLNWLLWRSYGDRSPAEQLSSLLGLTGLYRFKPKLVFLVKNSSIVFGQVDLSTISQRPQLISWVSSFHFKQRQSFCSVENFGQSQFFCRRLKSLMTHIEIEFSTEQFSEVCWPASKKRNPENIFQSDDFSIF